MPPWSMIMEMPFSRLYNVGRLSTKDALNLASHMECSCKMTTDVTSVYNQLTSATGSFHRKTEGRMDSKAEVNLGFHSVIKSYYRHYRGVSSKNINRYASMFAYAWTTNG